MSALESVTRNSVDVLPAGELERKLAKGRPLRVKLGIGLIELLQVAARSTWLDFNTLGYGMVGLFVLTWAVSGVIWKTRRIEERWSAASP